MPKASPSTPGLERYLNGGETQGLASPSGTAFLAVFVDGTAGTMQLRAATIEVTGAPTRR